MPLEWLAPLAATAELVPDLPEVVIHVKVGGIIGTLTAGYVAVRYQRDIGRALVNLTRGDDL